MTSCGFLDSSGWLSHSLHALHQALLRLSLILRWQRAFSLILVSRLGILFTKQQTVVLNRFPFRILTSFGVELTPHDARLEGGVNSLSPTSTALVG